MRQERQQKDDDCAPHSAHAVYCTESCLAGEMLWIANTAKLQREACRVGDCRMEPERVMMTAPRLSIPGKTAASEASSMLRGYASACR